MKFAFNQRVWDKVRQGPALVLEAGPDEYKVAEILGYLKLGRMAMRHEDQLDYYVEVGMPALEARAILVALSTDEPDGQNTAYLDAGFDRIGNVLEEVTGEEP